jgi:fimbrial chaperone protein
MQVKLKGLTRVAFMIGVGLVLAPAHSLRASAFHVTPIRVDFDRNTTSTVMTLVNESTEELRFQISVASWQQDKQGQMQLTPTDDIVFFPALLSLKAGEERKVRVGRTVAPSNVEKTYRISFEELPPLQKAGAPPQGSQVKIITKMSIPIFVVPENPKTGAEIVDTAIRNGKLTFDLKNSGNVHYMAQAVRVTGVGADNQVVFDRQRQGWYILSGETRTFDMEVKPEECAKLKSLRVEVRTDITEVPETSTLKKDFDMPSGACGH